MLELKDPVRYSNICLVKTKDSIYIPTEIGQGLPKDAIYEGKYYTNVKVIRPISEYKYLQKENTGLPTGIYEVLTDTVFIYANYLPLLDVSGLHININDIIVEHETKDSVIRRNKNFEDILSSEFHDKEKLFNKLSLTHKLKISEKYLRGFKIGDKLHLNIPILLKENKDPLTSVVLEDMVYFRSEVYLCLFVDSEHKFAELEKFSLDNDNSFIIDKENNFIKLPINSKYLEENLNYIVIDNNVNSNVYDNTFYVNNIATLLNFIDENYIINLDKKIKIGINTFKLDSIELEVLSKDMFNILKVYKNKSLLSTIKLPIVTIKSKLKSGDLLNKIFLKDANKKLKKYLKDNSSNDEIESELT